MATSVRPIAAVFAALLFAPTMLTGCAPQATTLFCSGSPGRPQTDHVGSHAVIVVGNVANSPRPELTLQQTEALEEILAGGGRVDLVSTAGDGFVCKAEQMRMKPLTPGMNKAGAEATIRDNLRALTREINAAPRDDGQDAYAALHHAAGQLESIGADRRTLIIRTSGLNDRGQLDYTVPGALGADVADTLRYLGSPGPLPRFPGVRVIASGLGFTAAPQTVLPAAARESVAATYHAILTASTEDVMMDKAPTTGDAIDTLGRTVTPVEVRTQARPATCTTQEIVYDQTSALRFVSDSTEFLNHHAAAAELDKVITWLREDPDRTVAILGTTARWGTREGQERMGRGRAQTVRDLLVAGGVRPEQVVSVTSNGSWFPDYINDQAPDGGLIPAAAAANRSVRLTLTDPC